MGYGSPLDRINIFRPQISLEDQLKNQKLNLQNQIEANNIKIISYENDIEELENQIKEGENYIRSNHLQLNYMELKHKSSQLIELYKDKDRALRNLDSLFNINETMKNNLENIEKKLEEERKVSSLKQANQIMEEYNHENNNEILANNINLLMEQRHQDENTKKILERYNNAYNGNDPSLQNVDAYLEQLLGNRNKGLQNK